MDKTDRLRDYGLAFLLYEQGLGVCGYELIRELFIFIKLILNSYLCTGLYITITCKVLDKNPERWLCYVLKHIDSTPEDKYYTLLPEFWEDEEQ